MTATRALLLRILDEAYERPAWHGPNLRSAVRGLRAADAARPPGEGRHSVWQLVLHCAYWKYMARRRLSGDSSLRFSRQGRNFFAITSASDTAWRADLALLAETHRALRTAVASAPAQVLETRARLVYGVAMHDVYHAGQIRLVRRWNE